MFNRRKSLLGDTEQRVMLALWRLNREAHGADIQAELEDCTGQSLSISAIHLTLQRLGDKGFVESSLGSPTPVRGGKARRLFRLLPEGRRALRSARAAMDRLWKGLVASRGLE